MSEKNPYTKKCKYEFCLMPFVAKRLNQEFCCRKHQTMQNNFKAKKMRDSTKNHDRILHNNRAILIRMYAKEMIDLSELQRHGFVIKRFTAILNSDNKKRVLFYYEYSLTQINDTTFKISKNDAL